ncbi:MAG: type II toxin-antitoxin system HicB family antitoxin [Dehalococcoidia bacterium]
MRSKTLSPKFLATALGKARYEILPDDGFYYGEVPRLAGVWASAATLEECREELGEVISDWVMLGLRLGHELPTLNGLQPFNSGDGGADPLSAGGEG